MSDSRIGVELDGARATLVTVTDGAATAAKAFTGATPADALTAALATVKRADRVRIAVVTPGSSVRRIDVTGDMLNSRAVFEDAVYNALPVPKEGTTTAGLFFDAASLVGNSLGAGVGAVAPTDPVDSAYRVLGRRKGEVVPPAFTLVGHDGLHLAIRDSNTDLTLVVNGYPVAYRQMRCGGLATVSALLGDGTTDVGERRLADALVTGGVPDPVAAAEVERYLRALAGEVRQTCDHWSRAGESVPDAVSAFGPGAIATDLGVYLRDVGLTLTQLPGLNRALATLPPQQRAAAAGAYFAALTVGADMPVVAFPNPDAAAVAAAEARRSKTARQVTAIVAVLAIGGAVVGAPLVKGVLDLQAAKSDQASAQARLDRVAKQADELDKITSLRGTYRGLSTSDPRWSQVIALVYSSGAKVGATVTSLSASSDGTNINVNVTASYSGDATSASRWLDDLTNTGHVTNAWLANFSSRNGESTVTFTFNLAVDQVSQPRALDAGSTK